MLPSSLQPVRGAGSKVIMNKVNPKELYLAKKEFMNQLSKIPKKNKQKFFCDLLRLIEYAQKDNYENFNF